MNNGLNDRKDFTLEPFEVAKGNLLKFRVSIGGYHRGHRIHDSFRAGALTTSKSPSSSLVDNELVSTLVDVETPTALVLDFSLDILVIVFMMLISYFEVRRDVKGL